MGLIPLVLLFVVFSGIINMFMGSASAKWAIMGPVFIPMFMLLGYSPELSQAVFRIGDSVTNVISPMMSFFALIIVYYQKYDDKSGIGTLISTLIAAGGIVAMRDAIGRRQFTAVARALVVVENDLLVEFGEIAGHGCRT
jgi:p-aminobenzoyl-glutamate transporter AbgT